MQDSSKEENGNVMIPRYRKSLEHLIAAEKMIPLGSQTFSKSKATFLPGIAPLYGDKAKGCNIWDLDGNRYVDLVSGLASVTLGYADEEINEAVAQQLNYGVTISLTHPIEAEVAERIIDMVPSAEMVRFGKNGSDATSAAVRIARAYTGRDHVITCGYHGWHDWYIGATPRGLGVPKDVSTLAHPVPYNDLDAIESELKSNQIAALVMEPMNIVWPNPGYLEGVRDLCNKYGALLVFDETITGFRFSNGGAQEYFNVLPDLSTFGKGLANGFPLSAVAGPAKYLKVLEKAFFSGTFGGELLSLTAANVVLKRLATQPVLRNIADFGKEINSSVNNIIEQTEMSQYLSLSGHPTWNFLNWNIQDDELAVLAKGLFMQEMCANGVLMISTHNLNASHDSSAAEEILNAYRVTLTKVKEALDSGNIKDFLNVSDITAPSAVR
jgi:glutamate-1-semialdehyde 2,1-aminomutase